ncbi:Rha family transcriptional regulator [Acinetobacter seifertii]|uniref:Rha family transcriptional regulator n=1 Tax=Acinetobacter seifertii TaxID=1530123 RepID=UPI0012504FCC|nr:Rha family transcriptional regulator [Acinetobacter seifertii]
MNTLIQIDDAVFIQDEQVKTTSLKVAEIFKKRHDNVVRKVESFFEIEHHLNFEGKQNTIKNFASANFSAHVQNIEIGNGAIRESKYYEMTKDGFIFLVMGFTGEEAALTKIAYINTFNQMAAMLYNAQGNHSHIHVGATVQLKAGGPIYTVSKIHYDTNGLMQDAEVIWHDRAKLCREVIPVACLSLDTKNLTQNKTLSDFWQSVQHYGIERLNHSRSEQILALNMTQVYQSIEGLPPKSQLSAILMQSRSPYPRYMQHNYAVLSVHTKKTLKCWMFNINQLQLLN